MTCWALDGRPTSIDRLVSEVGPAAHGQVEDLLATSEGLRSEQPTLLPDWTLGHLIAHLRLNAASHQRVLLAAQDGEAIGQYVGGAAGRAAAIEAESTRPVDELISELAVVNRELETLWRAMSNADWQQATVMRAGERPAFVSLWARWREVQIHAVDLGLAMTSDDWTDEFALAALDVNFGGDELRSIDDRLDPICVVQLFDGERIWASDTERAVTNHGHGTRQSLLAWVVGRPQADPIEWDREPILRPWP